MLLPRNLLLPESPRRLGPMPHTTTPRPLNARTPYCPQDKWTPLHVAAQKGHLPVVLALLAAGAKTEAKDEVHTARRMGCRARGRPGA